jgi:hypothetical protein
MALLKGQNSYVTVAEADAYFNDNVRQEVWYSKPELFKAKCLVTATSILDEFDWIGVAASDTQTLAFPRIGTYFEPKQGLEVELNPEAIPDRIINACCELACNLLINPTAVSDTSAVSSIEVGPIKLKDVRKSSFLTPAMSMAIKPLRKDKFNTWWRNN